MFDFVGGRNPRGLPNVYGATCTLKKPFVFGQYIKSRSEDVDRWRARVTAELQNLLFRI